MTRKLVHVDFKYLDSAKRRPRFYLFYRDEKGERHVEYDDNFLPYFYIDSTEDVSQVKNDYLRHKIINFEDGYTSMKGESVRKIILKDVNKDEFTNIKECFKVTYEDDVMPQNRYIIDNNIEFDRNQRIVYCDIETDLGSNTLTTDKPIISIVIFDEFLKKYICFVWREDLENKIVNIDNTTKYYFNNEVDMLEKFIEVMRFINADIFCGWFFSGFDVPYIINRMKLLGINHNQLSTLNQAYTIVKESKDETYSKIYGLSIVDLMQIYKKITYDSRPQNYKLSTVAKHVLQNPDTEKIKINIAKAWRENIEELLEYNKRDVELCYLINKKAKLIEFYLEVQQLIAVPLENVFQNSRLIDAYILRKYHNKIVFPSRRKNIETEVKGAICMNPISGLHKNIAVIDVKALYSNLYRTFNLSPETLVENGEVNIDAEVEFENADDSKRKVKLKTSFTTSKKGILPELLDEILAKMKEIEIERDKCVPGSIAEYILINKRGSLKVIANSCFGVMNFSSFRLYTPELSQSITFLGREILIFAKEKLEQIGYEIKYGDTDSLFVSLKKDEDDELIKESLFIQNYINERLIEFVKRFYPKAEKHSLEFDCEKIFKRLILYDVKKRYVGLLCMKKGRKCEELFSRGTEIIRKDSPTPIKLLLKEIFIKILNGESMKNVRIFIGEEKKKIKSECGFLEIGTNKQISKGLNDYKNLPQHIRATIYSNEYLNTSFGKADIPKMVFCKVDSNKEYPETDVIMVDDGVEVPSCIKIDWKKTFDLYLNQKLKMIDFIKNPDVSELYREDSSLMNYFGEIA